jgi:energy-coupling factor transport system ATP-binding protein
MNPVLLRARDLEFGYAIERTSATMALRGVSVEIRVGDRVGLLGASGSGKSTLLHLLTGLLRPDRGVIERPGGDDSMPSLVFQFPERQLFAETVAQDVGYGLRESGVDRAAIAPRVGAALADVGLPPAEFATRVPFHLSGGEMRRVALAGALAQQRSLLLLDEPTLGLDAEGLDRLREILDRVHARGVAYWMASHHVDFVCATCDRLVVLDAGGVAYHGAAAEFWREPERAARLGIDAPRTAALAARLRGAGVAGLGELPTEDELVTALGPAGR